MSSTVRYKLNLRDGDAFEESVSKKSKTISVRTLEECTTEITLSLMGPEPRRALAPDLADFGTNAIMAEIICLTRRERKKGWH